MLLQYPPLEEYLLKEAKLRHKPITGAHEVRRSIKRIHKRFLEECRALGIKPNEYPLNQELGGLRSLSEYFRRYDNRTFGAAVKSETAGRVRPAAPVNMEQAPPATRAFEVVEFDGHKIDLRVTLRITDPLGFEHLVELTRIWILVVLDIASRAVIGYKLALSKEYNKDDVAGAFQAALTPFRPRNYKIAGLAIRKEGGYTPHSLRVRTEITRLKRLGKLNYKDGDDPVEAWEKYKRSIAKKNKRAATDLAKAQTENKQLPPKLAAPAPVSQHVPADAVPETVAGRSEPTQADGAAVTALTQPPQRHVLRMKRTITF